MSTVDRPAIRLTQKARRFSLQALRYVSGPLRSLPDFLVVGAQRAGTTSLHEWLSSHPDVTASSRKELHFFDTGRRSPNWYRSQFPIRNRRGSRPLLVESTPRYLVHPLAPQRIHALLPDVQLLILLRNPVDRALSAYRMAVLNGRESLGLMDALRARDARLRPLLVSGVSMIPNSAASPTN